MSEPYLILLVEESDNSLGIYDSVDGQEVGRVRLSLWPHEIAISPDGRTAYVSNFGLRDYDLNLGYAGNAISVIDIQNRVETHRLYTATDKYPFWGPHGVKVSPDGKHLYVNVERVEGVRERNPDTVPGQDPTKLLVFDLATRKIVNMFDLHLPPPRIAAIPSVHGESEDDERPASIFDVVQGSHNFVFSPDGADLWIFSGRMGVTRLDPKTGNITARLLDFNGAVRSLSFTPDGQLLVSATNEITLINPKTLAISQRIGGLGVTQLLYSKATPDGRYVLAPAVWEGQIVVVDLKTEQVVTRIVTGIDPVQVMISPDKSSAYVTHGRSRWLSEIELSGFTEKRRIETLGGPNGAAFAPWSPVPAKRKILMFGACLPFTGEAAVEGRETRLGYQFWQERVNGAGGLMIDGAPHAVQIAYADTASTSDPEKIKGIGQRLISEQRVQLLLGSYPEIANLSLAQLAEDRQIPFVVGSGVADELFERNYKYVSAVLIDRFRFDCVLHGIWRRVSPKPRTVALITCDERFSRERARATAARLSQLGLSLVTPKDDWDVEEPGIIVFKHLSSDLLPLIQKIQELNPDILLHHGHRQEAVGLVQACQKTDFTPGAIALDFGITLAGFRDQLEGLLDCLIGSVHWSQVMATFAHDRFTGPSDFARNYFEEFSERASSFAAAAAACGIVVEHALREVQTAQPNRVQAAIRGLDFDSFFGHIKFDKSGRNIAGSSLAIQFRQVAGVLEEILLCPPSIANRSSIMWPFRGWPSIKG